MSHSVDETNKMYSIKKFSDIIKNNVHEFSIWSDILSDPECASLIKVIGMEKAHKVFSQRLNDIYTFKVGEVHPHFKTGKLEAKFGHSSDSG